MALILTFHAMVLMLCIHNDIHPQFVVPLRNLCRMARPIRPCQLCVCCTFAFHPNVRLKLTVCVAFTRVICPLQKTAWLAVADRARQRRMRRLSPLAWRAKGPGFKRLPRRTARILRNRSAIERKRRRLRLSRHLPKKLERVPSRLLRHPLLRSHHPRCRHIRPRR